MTDIGGRTGATMVARVWHGVVPAAKAESYAQYLTASERGVKDYQGTKGSRGVTLLRRAEGEHVHFLLISLWESRAAIRAYAGHDIERARYFAYDLECLLEPEPTVAHYDVLVAIPAS